MQKSNVYPISARNWTSLQYMSICLVNCFNFLYKYLGLPLTSYVINRSTSTFHRQDDRLSPGVENWVVYLGWCKVLVQFVLASMLVYLAMVVVRGSSCMGYQERTNQIWRFLLGGTKDVNGEHYLIAWVMVLASLTFSVWVNDFDLIYKLYTLRVGLKFLKIQWNYT